MRLERAFGIPRSFAQGGLMKEMEACGVPPPFAEGRMANSWSMSQSKHPHKKAP